MKGYLDISLACDGKKYVAKLYGDKIISEEANLEISRRDILRYRVNFFGRHIRLLTNDKWVRVDYLGAIIRWLDPLYTIRRFVVGCFVILPLLIVFILAGKKAATSAFFPLLGLAMVVSIVSGLLGRFFFKIIQQGRDYFYYKIFFLLLVVCLPAMYWYPFSVYIVAIASGIFLFFTLAHYLFQSAFNVYKYYLSLSWILLTIFLYFWIVTALKLVIDYQAYAAADPAVRESPDHSRVSAGDLTWVKPVDWKISRYYFLQTLLKRRQLLWQFSPLPVQLKISTPESGDIGWIASSSLAPAEVLKLMDTNLESQKNLLLADLLEKSQPAYESSKAGQIALRSFTYYDMIERKAGTIYTILVPVSGDVSVRTLAIAFKIPRGDSVNYYLDLIKDGLDVHPGRRARPLLQ